MAKRKPPTKTVNRKLVLQALTDKKFRKALAEDPKRALGARVSEVNQAEINLVLATVKGIESQVRFVADNLLCLTNGGGCGIASA